VRNSRLTPAGVTPLVAVAHGSRDPRAAATVTELLSVVRARAARRGMRGLDVRAAFLDHCAPSLPQVLGSLSAASDPRTWGPAVVVPLLLTAAYHSKADIPAQLAAAAAAYPGLDVVSAGTLGPHALLLAALERRLREAGVAVDDPRARAATGVVLAAAGSSDPAANATIADLAARWARERGWRAVLPAYASAAGPRPGDAVRALRAAGADRVAVATYLLAPGYFADKIRDGALGALGPLAGEAAAVSGVLGAAPEVADVVLDRYLAAASNRSFLPADLTRSRQREEFVRVADGVEVGDLTVGNLDQEDAFEAVAAVGGQRGRVVAVDHLDAHVRPVPVRAEEVDEERGDLVRAYHRAARRGGLAAAVGGPGGVRGE
jgi:sirohydrochlorin ferrochelatase